LIIDIGQPTVYIFTLLSKGSLEFMKLITIIFLNCLKKKCVHNFVYISIVG